MWHKTHKGTWCHVWDVVYEAFLLWKAGQPMRSAHVIFPNGKPPIAGTPVACGTCGTANFGSPKNMKQETLYIENPL
jgi:hypothetical protein